MVAVVAIGLGAPLFAGSPTHMDVAARLTPPNRAHWFGTDDVGRDVFSRVIHGARLSVLVGAAVVVFSFVVGVLSRLFARPHTPLDNPSMRGMDRAIAVPS